MKWLWKAEVCKGTYESWLCQVDNLPLPAGGGGPAARQVGRQQQLASRSATSHRAASRPRHAHLTDLFTNTRITSHPLGNYFAPEADLRSVASTEETAVCPSVCNLFPQCEHALWILLLRVLFFQEQGKRSFTNHLVWISIISWLYDLVNSEEASILQSSMRSQRIKWFVVRFDRSSPYGGGWM